MNYHHEGDGDKASSELPEMSLSFADEAEEPIVSCSCVASKSACTTGSCKCRKHGEPCQGACSCQRRCADQLWQFLKTCNNQVGDQRGPKALRSKLQQTGVFCKCARGSRRKRCGDESKCSCFRALKSCDKLTCKCRCSCSNGSEAQEWPAGAGCADTVRKWFLRPEKGASRAMIAQFIADNSTHWRAYYATDKEGPAHAEIKFHQAMLRATAEFQLSIREIVLFLPTSPCFHQDCNPLCDVLDQCNVNNACAETLAIAYRQLQKRTERTDMQMTVKLLASYVRRGDLYTKQGIMCMMLCGINVEPITMKEWMGLVKTADESTAHNAYYRDLWNRLNLAEYSLQTQCYVNECRQEMGLRTMYWDGALHNLLRKCIVISAKGAHGYATIVKQLAKNQTRTTRRRCRSATSISTYKRSQSVDSSLSRGSRLAACRCSSPLRGADQALDGSYACTASTSSETSIGLVKNGPVANYKHHRSQQLYTSKAGAHETNCPTSTSTLQTEDEQIIKLLINLSGRIIDEMEAREITDEVTKIIQDVQERIANLVSYLQRTIDSTAL